jgi:hypothetical protein
MPTNNMGPWQSASNLEYQNAGGTPPPTGDLDPPQSPSGSATNESATFNYAHGVTSTEEFLTDVIVVDSAQQGTNVQNAVCSFNSLNPANFQTFRWE